MRVGPRPSTGPGQACRSCRARVIWAITESGRPMPVDPAPVDAALLPEARNGNLVLWYQVDGYGRPIGQQRVCIATTEQRADAATPLWRSHFATCPSAAEHRRTK